MKEYKINECITLKLESKTTVIYINNSRFIQCKKLVLDIPINDILSFETINSIDEVAERLKKSVGPRGREVNIPPEDEFWGHCSNIQAWVENNYNTDLLHTDLSFPLLRELAKIGDSVAKEVLKEEILHRLMNGQDNAIIFLLDNDYLEYFTKEEISFIYKENSAKFESSRLLFAFTRALAVQKIPDMKHNYKELVKEKLLKKIKDSNDELIDFCHYLVAMEKKELIDIFEQFKLSKSANESEKFRVLDILMQELQFDYSGVINFKMSEVAKILLVKSEQTPFLDIVTHSDYPYIQLDFAADEVHRRYWRAELYFDFLEGHAYSIELDYNRFNEKAFYVNLSSLKNFSKLEVLNLLFWDNYDFSLVRQTLSQLKPIKLIQIYEYFKDPPNFIQMGPEDLK